MSQLTSQDTERTVVCSVNSEQEQIIGVTYQHHTYYFNSRYNDEGVMEQWLAQSDMKNYASVAFVIGMGNGSYLRRLRQENSDMMIVCFEPLEEIVRINRKNPLNKNLFKKGKTIIISGKDAYKLLYQVTDATVSFSNYLYVKLFIVPNYDVVFYDDVKKVIDMYREKITRMVLTRNTNILFEQDANENVTDNMLDYVEQYSLSDLIDVFQNVDKEMVPAIIVSAGPSLDKNIEELANAKNKAFIIAVDTALNALHEKGIVPDIAVTIDPYKPLELFPGGESNEIPFVMSIESNKEIKKHHRGIRIYEDEASAYVHRYNVKYNKRVVKLGTGGSVANTAYSLAYIVGFKTIIFVGQDLAYPNGKEHTEAAYHDDEKNTLPIEDSKRYFEVEGIDGEMVKTEQNMDAYRKWFEQAAQLIDEVHFIDATEGGAKIHGFQIMTLKDAIGEKCDEKTDIDFSELIRGMKPRFTEDEKTEIYQDLLNFNKFSEKMEKRIHVLMDLYRSIGNMSKEEILKNTRLIKRITAYNNWAVRSKDMAFLTRYATYANYRVLDEAFEKREKYEDEIELIANNGIKLGEALLEGLRQMEKDFQKVILETEKKVS